MKKIIIFSLFLLLSVLGCFGQTKNQSKTNRIEWVPSTINGITLGKSKYDDLIKLWGKPLFERDFASQDEELDPDLETELAYRNVEIDNLKPSIGVVIENKSHLVKVISLFFDEMTKDEAIRKYGSDYYLVTSQDSDCIDKSQKKEKDIGKFSYPISLVYPQKGMSISIRNDNTVMMVNYTDKCQ